MRRADAGAGQHRDRQLRDHRHVDGDPVALLHAEPAQRVREAAHLLEQLLVGDRAGVARLALPVVGDAVAEAGGDMAIEAVDADVELAADEPLRIRHVPRVELAPRLHPVEPVALFGPEGAKAVLGGGAVEDARIGHDGVRHELLRRRERAVLAQEILDRRLDVLFSRHAPILVPVWRPIRHAPCTHRARGPSSAGGEDSWPPSPRPT